MVLNITASEKERESEGAKCGAIGGYRELSGE